MPIVADLLETTIDPLGATLPFEGEAVRGEGRAVTRLGRFEVLGRLGRGAMGEVVRAKDPALGREVAIKVLASQSLGRPLARARLLREAQAMAKLRHPNVVTVYEVDASGDEALVVMECVEGTTLRAYCHAGGRTTAEVLRAFAQAGRGLWAVHQAGLVHRDFKPDNVLVGRDGRVCVTDFGLVGLTEGEAGEASTEAPLPDLSLTRSGALLGTPAYMAPEQHEGRAADARADQFAFCVALWEALVGERPFDGATYTELREAIVAGARREPPKGSRLPSRVRRALERGLSVSRGDRYPDMGALLGELTRDPTLAWRRALGAAAALGLAGLAALGWARRGPSAPLCQGGEARLAGAWDEASKARVREAFLGTGRPYAEDVYRRVERALDERARSWVAMYADSCEATHVRGEQSPALLDLRTQCLERHRRELGALVKLLGKGPDPEVLGRAAQAAVSLPDAQACADGAALSAITPPPSGPAARAAVDALKARVDEARATFQAGTHEDGLALASALVGEAKGARYAPLEAEALHLLESVQRYAGDYKGAEATSRELVLVAAQAGDDALLAWAWGSLLYSIGVDQGRHAEALALRPAAEAAVARVGEDRAASASVIATLGNVFSAKGDYAEGIKYLERAASLYERTGGPEHPGVATSLNALANALESVERREDARRCYERALAIYEKNFGPDNFGVAMILNNLGDLDQGAKRWDEARGFYERALAVYERRLEPEHPEAAIVTANLGILAHGRGRLDEARRFDERALALFQKSLGPEHPHVASVLDDLGGVALDAGRWGEARSFYERALAVREKALGPEHDETAETLAHLARAIGARGEPEKARALHARAVAIQEKALGPDAEALVESLTGLGEDYLLLRQPAKALAPLERAVAVGESKSADGDPAALAAARFALARALWSSPRERPRALALAEGARASMAALGEAEAAPLAGLDAWLRERAALRRGPVRLPSRGRRLRAGAAEICSTRARELGPPATDARVLPLLALGCTMIPALMTKSKRRFAGASRRERALFRSRVHEARGSGERRVKSRRIGT